MRKILAFSALALASCGGNAPTSDNAVREESTSTEVTAVNDVTAIDAATADAQNMAADVDYNLDENGGNADAASNNNSSSTGN